MNNNNWQYEPATEETLSIFEPVDEPEILTGVVLTRCRVISYNPHSNIIVYERDGKQIQTNVITDYNGEGWIEVE